MSKSLWKGADNEELRRYHDVKLLPYLGQQLVYIRDDPSLAFV